MVFHALENLHHQSLHGEDRLVSQFVTTSASGYLIRVQMAAVLGSELEITGFVLTLADITRDVQIDQSRELLFYSLTQHTRSALANMRSAIENLIEYEDMDPRNRVRFLSIIRDEAVRLSEKLDETTSELSSCGKTMWPLEDVRGTDLLASIKRRVESQVGVKARNRRGDPALWLKVDSFNVSQAVTFLSARLKEELGVEEVALSLGRSDRMAHIDLSWSGAPLLQLESVLAWEDEPMSTDLAACAITLRELAERHGGEVWYHGDPLTREAYIRLLLPVAEQAETLAVHAPAESRPVYYDFDLFGRYGQGHELDERPLSDLTYTVFDTETTGLEPSRGDEILSIGAVRIVNNRLLHTESFDQLVDPKRPISPQSIGIHGITSAMVRGQPTIDLVLPQFQRFVEDTVLVAHNAAFDLRFLELKQTGDRGVPDQPGARHVAALRGAPPRAGGPRARQHRRAAGSEPLRAPHLAGRRHGHGRDLPQDDPSARSEGDPYAEGGARGLREDTVLRHQVLRPEYRPASEREMKAEKLQEVGHGFERPTKVPPFPLGPLIRVDEVGVRLSVEGLFEGALQLQP